MEDVGKEGEVAVLLVIMVSDKPEFFGVLLKVRKYGQDFLENCCREDLIRLTDIIWRKKPTG